MNTACVIMTTFEDEPAAQQVIDSVLDRGLAACAQTVGIKSHYSWKGELHHDRETMVIFKTTSQLGEALSAAIEDMHPYEVPEITRLDGVQTTRAYEAWMRSVTRDTPQDGHSTHLA